MALKYDFTLSNNIFIGADKILEFEVLDADDLPVDVSAFTMAFAAGLPGSTAFIAKTSAVGGGITVTGTYDAVRAANTQRVRVAIASANTSAQRASRQYEYSLTREDAGYEDTLAWGAFPLRAAYGDA